MECNPVLSQLKSQSTGRLFLLSAITLGVYAGHYMKRQTTIINQYLGSEDHLPKWLPTLILIMAYLSVVLFALLLVADEGHPVEGISNFLDRIWGILLLLWAFKVRRKMNTLLSSSIDQPSWFKGLWTFLFAVFYINYKINVLNENLAESGATMGSATPN